MKTFLSGKVVLKLKVSFFSFDPFVKKHDGPRERRDHEKLLHKMKREKKSAKKELRKDTAFIAKQKAVETRERLVWLKNIF